MATSNSFSQFGKRMNIRANKVVFGARLAVRRAALAADRTVVDVTPLDTGRAKGNWIVSVGNPDHSTFEEGQANAASAIAQGKSVIEGWTKGTIFISNSLPYIGKLEDGWSQQAPDGMVTRAYDAARAELVKARLMI